MRAPLMAHGLDYLYLLADSLITLGMRKVAGLELGKGTRFRGLPRLRLRFGGRIVIGQDVMINSRDRGYHLNLHSATKLYAYGKDALIMIGDKSRVHGACLHARSLIRVGANCLIAANTQIVDSSGHDLAFDAVESRIDTRGKSAAVVIEDCVWIGANSIVLPGVTIGRGSVIGAGSVVTRDVPPMVVAAGNPARVVRKAGVQSTIEP